MGTLLERFEEHDGKALYTHPAANDSMTQIATQ